MTIEYTLTRTINNMSLTESVKVTPCENERLNIGAAIKEIAKALIDVRINKPAIE